MKLSIVVPIYNVEVFLPRCLDSLLRQGLKAGEYEIVCVNDGSTDDSAMILSDYAERYSDIIRVITQDNQGLGCARNTGVDVAHGEYVAFVDSDDYLIDGAYHYLCEHFLKDSPDVIHFDACMMETDGKMLIKNAPLFTHNSKMIHTDGKSLVDPQAMPEGKLLLDGDGTDIYNKIMLSNTWTKIIKRSFILQHNLKAEPVIGQDELFNFVVFQHHPHTIVVSSCLYRYEQANPNSAQHTFDKKRVLTQLDQLLFHNIVIMEKYLEEIGDGAELSKAARRNINIFKLNFFERAKYIHLTRKEWQRYSKKLRELPQQTPHDNSPNWKTKSAIMLQKLSEKEYMFVLVRNWLWKFHNYLHQN